MGVDSLLWWLKKNMIQLDFNSKLKYTSSIAQNIDKELDEALINLQESVIDENAGEG